DAQIVFALVETAQIALITMAPAAKHTSAPRRVCAVDGAEVGLAHVDVTPDLLQVGSRRNGNRLLFVEHEERDPILVGFPRSGERRTGRCEARFRNRVRPAGSARYPMTIVKLPCMHERALDIYRRDIQLFVARYPKCGDCRTGMCLTWRIDHEWRLPGSV